MSIGQYRLSPVTLTDAQVSRLMLDNAGNLKTVSVGSGATSAQVQGNVASGATDSGNPVKIAGVYNTTAPTFTNGQRGDVQLTSRGEMAVKIVDSAASTSLGLLIGPFAASNGNAFASLGNAPVSAFNAYWDATASQWKFALGDSIGAYMVPKPGTSGGLTPASIRTGTTGVIKASAGQAFNLVLQNTNAAVRYLHLYNKATAPTLSTDTPVITIQLPASSAMINPSLSDTHGVAFATGIAWAYTTDNNTIPTTVATSGELIATALYK